MTILYHINPITGLPGVCHAKNGNCPYGTRSQHFNSYEEAQSQADKIAEQRFIDYQKEENNDEDSIAWNDVSKFNYLNEMPKEDVLNEIRDTSDVDLLNDVIQRNVLQNTDDNDTDYIDTAFTNDNLSIDLMDDIQDNPEMYTQHALLAFENNDMLDSIGKVELMKGYPDDSIFCKQIAMNKGIRGEAIAEILDDLKNKNSEDWPNNAAMLIYNDNCPKKVFDEWTLTPLFSNFINKK